ncbi:MAG: protoglobin domain-containing protein, partial [Steroidobacteraceae bacterium]
MEIPDHIDLSEGRILERQHALGVGPADRARLRRRLAAVQRHWPAFLDDLYERLGAHADTAALLQSRPDTLQRLTRAQTRYLNSLFGAEHDTAHARFLAQLGLVHYRLGVTPQWYVATYAHFICDHLEVLDTLDGSPAERLADMTALIRSVFYDLGFVLDAYGIGEATEILQRDARGRMDSGSPSTADGRPPESRRDPLRDGADLAQVHLTSDDVLERARFLAIGAPEIAALRSMRGVVAAATPAILDEFYAFFSAHPETAALVPEGVVERLKRQVASYWAELVNSDFSRPYAASRMRVGLVHERIGLSLHWYFGGVARQLIGFLQVEGVRGDPVRQRALIKAVFFDLTHVVDAYMEARADALLRGAGHAAALIASLDAAIAIVDSKQRVVAANQAMVDLFPGDAGMLYRMPITQALPMNVLQDSLAQLLGGHAPRVVGFGTLGARRLKVTAFRLSGAAGAAGAAGSDVGIALDDVTDLLRASTEGGSHRDRLLDVIATSSAVLWEMDAADLSINVISGSVLGLVGLRDVHFAGRPQAWIECVAPCDRQRVRDFLCTDGAQSGGDIDYRMIRADGVQVWVRSHVSRIKGAAGASLMRAVTVSIDSDRRTEAARMQSLGNVAG